jgi:hypothetical protein
MLQSLFPHTENPLPLKSALCLSGAEGEFQPLIKTAAAAELKHLQSTPSNKIFIYSKECMRMSIKTTLKIK